MSAAKLGSVIVECKKCGAPLEVKLGRAFAKCAYCGHANKVKSARTLMAERPPEWRPPPVWTPPRSAAAPSAPLPYRPPAARAKSKGTGCVVPGLLFSGLALALGFGLLYQQLGGLGGIDSSAPPTLGTVDLDAVTNAPRVFSGEASGSWQANGLGDGCRGYISSAPQGLLRSSGQVSVQLDVDSTEDLVMALLTADGRWICDDDSGDGVSPALSVTLGPGEHSVWVGPYSNNQAGSYTLTVTSQALGEGPMVAGLSIDSPPQLGVVHVSDAPTHGIWDGATTPTVDASTLAPGCRGFIPVVPHIAIDAQVPRPIHIETAETNADLVLVARTPSGQFICDDDSGNGLNARLEMTPEVGRTAVWVGSFAVRGTANFSLEVSDPGARRSRGTLIAPSEAPLLGHLDLDADAWTPVHEGTTRSEVDARTLAPDCNGWVGVAPDLVVLTTIPREMEITTSSRADLTLIVRGPDGSFVCDDDSGERNSPRVHQSWAAGAHQVWVGAIRARAASYQLVVAETPL